MPAFHLESKDENLRLAKIWDAKGLLRLFREPLQEGHFCRVFNAHKPNLADRHIGTDEYPMLVSSQLMAHPGTYLQVFC